MKKILTGLSNRVTENKQKIKIWSESFRKHSDGDIVLIVANATEQDLITCEELNIKYYPVTIDDTWYINHKRLEHTRNFLRESDGDLFMITDVFDVIFQEDPFRKFDLGYDLFFTAEGILISEEPWNSDVINKVFPGEIESCRNDEIICSGIIGGKREQLIDLYTKMFDKCEIGTNEHNIKDQAALILLLANNQIENYKIFTLNDAWAMHCSTSGPTQFFEGWGLKARIEMRYNVPKRVDGKVYTNNGEIFDIVHQFNRVPEWNEILTKEYE